MSLRAAVFAGLQILFAFSLKVLKSNDKPETMVPLAHWTTAVRREDVAQSNCNTTLLCIRTPTVYRTVCILYASRYQEIMLLVISIKK